MNAKQLLGAVCAMILRVAVAAVVIILVYRLAVGAYDFGFQVFADIPVDEDEGRTVSVVISDDLDTGEIGELLEAKGLINDARVFSVQVKLADDKGDIVPGAYELNTAMSVDEMLEIMCGSGETEEAAE